ncbi:MAG: hypothetical protein GX046_05235, partial [Tissierellia bacterium]|nr:hypothetical protein [Tissierellia bacterium]
MKKGYLYTILFMALVSIILTSILAVSNAAFLPTIESNTLKAQKIAILDAFGVVSQEPEDYFDTNVKEKDFGIVSGY